MREINEASILGFIPTNYPEGVILAERWNGSGIEYVTAFVDDINESTEWKFGNYFGTGTHGEFMRRARQDMIARAERAFD